MKITPLDTQDKPVSKRARPQMLATAHKACTNAPPFRGFEVMPEGVDPKDTLMLTPWVGGICSISQSAAAHAGRAWHSDMAEPAGGSLGHRVVIEDGRIAISRIIAPATSNLSPRDAGGRPGPFEAAPVGAPIADSEDARLSLRHIARSFDPSMICKAH